MQGQTKLVAIKVGDIEDTLEVSDIPHSFVSVVRKLHKQWRNPHYSYARKNFLQALRLCVSLSNSDLSRPEGCYGLITKHGRSVEVKEAGWFCALPCTRIQYLVTMQSIVYDLPVKACPTIDNIFVEIDVTVVFKIKSGDEGVRNFVYHISVNQFNEQLEAALTERMRVLARTKTHLEIYQIKGKDHTGDILEFLNNMFADKGIEFQRVIITNVRLPADIAGPLDQKAQFASMNEYERTRHEFDLLVINHEEDLELRKQKKGEERDQTNEQFQNELALEERKLELINADGEKQVQEINEKKIAEVKKIQAESELRAQEIMAETKILSNKLKAEGRMAAEKITVENDAYCQKILAE